MNSEVLFILKLLAISGLISLGIKLLGLFITLDTPPTWVPLMVVFGTMGGVSLLLVWQSLRDTPPPGSTHTPSEVAAHTPPPPPETGDSTG